MVFLFHISYEMIEDPPTTPQQQNNSRQGRAFSGLIFQLIEPLAVVQPLRLSDQDNYNKSINSQKRNPS